jgi:hypothetical protein
MPKFSPIRGRSKTITAVSLVLFFVCFALIPPASSVMNGKVALGDTNVITLFFGDGASQNYCSGIYIRERIAATAAHCLLVNQIQVGNEYLNFFKHDRNDIYVSEPGINWKQFSEKRVKVLDYFIPNPYIEKWENTFPGRERDIAFLFLERELSGKKLDGIANKELMEELKTNGAKVVALGYGSTGYQIRNEGLPYSAIHEARFRMPERLDIEESKYLSAVGVESGSICPGDSGGGIVYEQDQKRFLVGVISGGGTLTCHFGTSHNGSWSVEAVLAWPYEEELSSKYSKFLEQESMKQVEAKVTQQKYQCKKGKKLRNLLIKSEKCPKGFKKVLKTN